MIPVPGGPGEGDAVRTPRDQAGISYLPLVLVGLVSTSCRAESDHDSTPPISPDIHTPERRLGYGPILPRNLKSGPAPRGALHSHRIPGHPPSGARPSGPGPDARSHTTCNHHLANRPRDLHTRAGFEASHT